MSFSAFGVAGAIAAPPEIKSVNRLSLMLSRYQAFASSIRPTKRLNR
jgi:hypothetical protein